jgi:molecular chaperone GrpE (heat shock protein)
MEKHHSNKSDSVKIQEQNHLETIEHKIKNIEEQNSMMLNQIINLSGLIYGQQNQIGQLDEKILQEFKKLQSRSVQQAMASVFHKFFKDLIGVMNNMDDLLSVSNDQINPENMNPWLESVKILRSSLEAVLIDWGCVPVKVVPGQDQFDPEFHQAIGVHTENENDKKPENTILKVQRRGWKVQETIIQYPQVITN